MEDRQGRRVGAQFEVGLLGDLVDGKGRLVDVSTGGCRLRSSESVRPNSRLHVFLRSPHAEVRIKIELAAIRWADGQEFGLECIRVHPEQQKRLGHLVTALQQMKVDVAPTQPSSASPQGRRRTATIRQKQDPSRR